MQDLNLLALYAGSIFIFTWSAQIRQIHIHTIDKQSVEMHAVRNKYCKTAWVEQQKSKQLSNFMQTAYSVGMH